MAVKKKKVEHVFTGMEIDESLDLHIRAWKLQPFAWAVIGLFVAAGLAGLFGTGLLSNVSKQQGQVRIDYERYFRFGTVMKMEFTDGSGGPRTEVIFPTDYLSRFDVQSVVPEPLETEILDGQVKYIFATGSARRKVFFYLEPNTPGTAKGSIAVNSQHIHLSQFIFP
jgi:hypothetical protein